MATVTSSDGTKIGYTKIGTGHPLIIIDGALCSRAFGPTPDIGKMLSEYFAVINYDRRGRNESTDTAPYSVDKEVDDIDALIKEVGSPVHLLGFSSGAGLALQAAARGLNISKLVLYEPPYITNMGGHTPPADSVDQFKKMVSEGRQGDAVKFFMKDLVGMPAFIPVIMSLLPMWKKLKASAHTLSYDASVMEGFTVPVKLTSQVKVPTYIMGGEKSALPLRNAVKKLSEVMPGSHLVILKGQNHNVSPKALVPVVVEKLKN